MSPCQTSHINSLLLFQLRVWQQSKYCPNQWAYAAISSITNITQESQLIENRVKKVSIKRHKPRVQSWSINHCVCATCCGMKRKRNTKNCRPAREQHYLKLSTWGNTELMSYNVCFDMCAHMSPRHHWLLSGAVKPGEIAQNIQGADGQPWQRIYLVEFV